MSARSKGTVPGSAAGRGPVRDLTDAERTVIARRVAHERWIFLALAAVPLVPGVALARQAVAADGRGRAPLVIGAVVLLAIAAFAAYLGLMRSPAREGGRLRRVGALRGLYFVSGKPARSTLDGVTLILPPTWLGVFVHGEPADVEITPPLEDDPRPSLPRLVVSAYGGRLRITDAASTAVSPHGRGDARRGAARP